MLNRPSVVAMLATALLLCADARAQNATSARGMAATCANCHGTDGRSVGAVPALAGADKANMMRQMQDFKAGTRPATIMHQLAKGYTDAQIELLAAYFAAQEK